MTNEDQLLFVKRNYKLFIYLCVIGFITYGYASLHPDMTIDRELFGLIGSAKEDITLGRWGLAFIYNFLLFDGIVPYFSTLLTICLLAIAVIVFLDKIAIDFNVKFIFGLLLITYPGNAYYMYFSYQSAGVTIGIISAILSHLFYINFLTRSHVFLAITSIFFTIFSVSCYQSLIILPICLFLIYNIQNLIFGNKNTVKNIIKQFSILIIFLIISMILYFTISYIILSIFKIKASQYSEIYVQWGRLKATFILEKLEVYIAKHLNGGYFYGEKTIISIYIALFVLLYSLFMSRSSSIFFVFILCLFLIFSQFILPIAFGYPLPQRAQIVESFIFASFWLFVFSSKIKSKHKNYLTIIVIVVTIYNIQAVTRLFYANSLAYQSDKNISSQIYSKILEIAPQAANGEIPIAFIGNIQPNTTRIKFKDEIFGGSIFEWDEGNPIRILSFFLSCGYHFIRIASPKEFISVVNHAKSLPSWPKLGSITLYKNILVVKFSDPLSTNFQWMSRYDDLVKEIRKSVNRS